MRLSMSLLDLLAGWVAAWGPVALALLLPLAAGAADGVALPVLRASMAAWS